jgi:DNA polymerase-3 subunit epsilon
MRQVVLDTETTGLDPASGHRIIEIGCVELIDRRLTGNNYHQYLQPDREIEQVAMEVHGISNEFLLDKPRFVDVAEDFLAFVHGAELIIHNAPFDVGFINQEIKLILKQGVKSDAVDQRCQILDTLVMARKMHPGQKNNLDALCQRYEIDNTQRTLHGALLDAEILADVYLAMTGGQTGFFDESQGGASLNHSNEIVRIDSDREALPIIRATEDELSAHEQWLQKLDQESGTPCLWRQLGDD